MKLIEQFVKKILIEGAAHVNLFKKALSFVKLNDLEYEVSHASSTTSKYLTVYIRETTGDWGGEFRIRFSDHKTPNENFHGYDSFLHGNKWSNLEQLLNKCKNLDGRLSPTDPFLDFGINN